MRAIHLQTEYLTEPLGLDIVKPRFYWQCEGGVKQTAYQIIAARDGETIWDSGKVVSSSMTHILYEGKPLKSRDRVEWTVTLWDEHDAAGEEVSSWFEMGLLEPSDWKGRWISGNYAPKKNVRYPVDYFKKVFPVKEPIRRARLYITARGLYEAHINGRRAGDFILAPGCTDYRKRIQYQTYDVTDLLQTGENMLELSLADGWYRGSVGCFGLTNVYGRRTSILCQLEISGASGEQITLVSDGGFSWSSDGPVRFADLKDGEIVNAAMRPSYSGKALVCKDMVIPKASNNVAVTLRERFKPVLMITPNGEKVLDFGQNLAGVLAFRVKGEKGQAVKLCFGEILDEAGNFSQKNIHKHRKPVKEFGPAAEMLLMLGMEDKIRGEMQPTPRQELTFFCSGGQDQYQMAFSVFGFQYVKVDTELEIKAEDFEAVAVYSELEETGAFTCSNELVDQLFRNTCWSMKGNFLDIPTDCPTRERLGWLGEGQTFFVTANYLMAAAPFYRKWANDIQDGQKKSGIVSAVIPYVGLELLYGSNGTSVGWADAMVLIPYRFWKHYNDRRMIEDCYDMMRRYGEFMISHTGQKNKKAARANPHNQYTYEKGVQLGEWLEPKEFLDTDNDSGAKLTLQTEVCTAYLHYTMKLLTEIAHELGKSGDEAKFRKYADGAKKAYHWLYLQNGAPDTDRQAKLVRPLALGLVEGVQKKELEKRLVQAVKNRRYRIGTGFLSTPFVLGVLTEAGRVDLAYKMLENEEAPGWLYEVKQGATTMWEDWEGSEYASRNHYAMGTVCQWIFDTVLGIQPDGENHFIVAPIPGGTLKFADGSYKSIFGEIKVCWKKSDSGIMYHVEVPANCTAEIILPGRNPETVLAGKYDRCC